MSSSSQYPIATRSALVAVVGDCTRVWIPRGEDAWRPSWKLATEVLILTLQMKQLKLRLTTSGTQLERGGAGTLAQAHPRPRLMLLHPSYLRRTSMPWIWRCWPLTSPWMMTSSSTPASSYPGPTTDLRGLSPDPAPGASTACRPQPLSPPCCPAGGVTPG